MNNADSLNSSNACSLVWGFTANKHMKSFTLLLISTRGACFMGDSKTCLTIPIALKQSVMCSDTRDVEDNLLLFVWYCLVLIVKWSKRCFRNELSRRKTKSSCEIVVEIDSSVSTDSLILPWSASSRTSRTSSTFVCMLVLRRNRIERKRERETKQKRDVKILRKEKSRLDICSFGQFLIFNIEVLPEKKSNNDSIYLLMWSTRKIKRR